MNNKDRIELLSNLAAFASAKGIDCETSEGRNTVRSLAVTILVNDFGVETEKAYDMIWGDNAYETLKGKVCDALKAEAA